MYDSVEMSITSEENVDIDVRKRTAREEVDWDSRNEK
jgi:hypothetical protein